MKLPIYSPKPAIDPDRYRLVELLGQLLDEKLCSHNSNLSVEELALSESERTELQELVERISTERSLFIALAFVDGLLGKRGATEASLREIYISERKRRGYSRALSSGAWHQFKTRLGGPSQDLSTYLRSARRMPYEHFMRMERRLLSAFTLPDGVRAYVTKTIDKERGNLEAIREVLFTRSHDAYHSVQQNTKDLLDQVRQRRETISSQQLAGLLCVVADSSVLFTTRDWSLAGTISTMAGGAVLAKGDA
jgi:hypothetical protein